MKREKEWAWFPEVSFSHKKKSLLKSYRTGTKPISYKVKHKITNFSKIAKQVIVK